MDSASLLSFAASLRASNPTKKEQEQSWGKPQPTKRSNSPQTTSRSSGGANKENIDNFTKIFKKYFKEPLKEGEVTLESSEDIKKVFDWLKRNYSPKKLSRELFLAIESSLKDFSSFSINIKDGNLTIGFKLKEGKKFNRKETFISIFNGIAKAETGFFCRQEFIEDNGSYELSIIKREEKKEISRLLQIERTRSEPTRQAGTVPKLRRTKSESIFGFQAEKNPEIEVLHLDEGEFTTLEDIANAGLTTTRETVLDRDRDEKEREKEEEEIREVRKTLAEVEEYLRNSSERPSTRGKGMLQDLMHRNTELLERISRLRAEVHKAKQESEEIFSRGDRFLQELEREKQELENQNDELRAVDRKRLRELRVVKQENKVDKGDYEARISELKENYKRGLREAFQGLREEVRRQEGNESILIEALNRIREHLKSKGIEEEDISPEEEISVEESNLDIDVNSYSTHQTPSESPSYLTANSNGDNPIENPKEIEERDREEKEEVVDTKESPVILDKTSQKQTQAESLEEGSVSSESEDDESSEDLLTSFTFHGGGQAPFHELEDNLWLEKPNTFFSVQDFSDSDRKNIQVSSMTSSGDFRDTTPKSEEEELSQSDSETSLFVARNAKSQLINPDMDNDEDITSVSSLGESDTSINVSQSEAERGEFSIIASTNGIDKGLRETTEIESQITSLGTNRESQPFGESFLPLTASVIPSIKENSPEEDSSSELSHKTTDSIPNITENIKTISLEEYYAIIKGNPNSDSMKDKYDVVHRIDIDKANSFYASIKKPHLDRDSTDRKIESKISLDETGLNIKKGSAYIDTKRKNTAHIKRTLRKKDDVMEINIESCNLEPERTLNVAIGNKYCLRFKTNEEGNIILCQKPFSLINKKREYEIIENINFERKHEIQKLLCKIEVKLANSESKNKNTDNKNIMDILNRNYRRPLPSIT